MPQLTRAAGSRETDYEPALSTCQPLVVAPHATLPAACRVPRSRSHTITAATTEPKADVAVVKVNPPESTEKNGNGKAPSPQPPKLPEIPAPTQKPFVQVLGQKLLDTGDDVLMHATRAFQGHEMETATVGGLKKVDGMDVYVSNKPIVLVLGFGWAAHSLAKACPCFLNWEGHRGLSSHTAAAFMRNLQRAQPVQVIDIERFDVVICSPRNHFIFTYDPYLMEPC